MTKSELLNVQTSKESGEQLSIQSNTEKSNTDKQNSLIERRNIVGTPFQIVMLEDNKNFIAMGNRRLTDYMEVEELKRKIEDKDWDLIMNCITTVVTVIQEEQKEP